MKKIWQLHMLKEKNETRGLIELRKQQTFLLEYI